MSVNVDVRELFATAVAGFGRVLRRVTDEDWDRPTPCTEWDVRQLVAHVVDEHRWIEPLLAGRRIPEVAAELDDDVLGNDPFEAWHRWTSVSTDSVRAVDDAGDRVVHLSFGDTTADEYLSQLSTDHLVHTWDLAHAIGGDQHLDEYLVGWVGHWFASVEDDYRAAGLIAERTPVPPGASARTLLLALMGRADGPTAAAVTRFDEAVRHRDLDALAAAMTDDAVFESTTPPDGRRHEGIAAVREAFDELFRSSPDARFATEELVVAGSRAFLRWRYDWGPSPADHVRGIDVYTVREGLVAEKLTYVKG